MSGWFWELGKINEREKKRKKLEHGFSEAGSEIVEETTSGSRQAERNGRVLEARLPV